MKEVSVLSVYMKITQSCLILCDPMDYTVHGILQARIQEWVAFPFSKGSSQPRDQTRSPALQVDSLPLSHQGSPPRLRAVCLVTQSCLTLWDSMGSSPPVSSVHWILQARILEWVAMPSSRGSSQSRDQTRSPALQANYLPSKPPGKP